MCISNLLQLNDGAFSMIEGGHAHTLFPRPHPPPPLAPHFVLILDYTY